MNSILHYNYIRYLLIFNLFFTSFLLSMPGQEIEGISQNKGKKRKHINEDNRKEEAKKQKIENQAYINQLSDIQVQIFKNLEDKSSEKLVLILSYHKDSTEVEVFDNFKKNFNKTKSLFENIITDSNQTYFPYSFIENIGDIKNIEYFMVIFNIKKQVMFRYIKLIGEIKEKKFKITSVNKKRRKETRSKRKKVKRINNKIEKEKKQKIQYQSYIEDLPNIELNLFKELENESSSKPVLIFSYHKDTSNVKLLDDLKKYLHSIESVIKDITTNSSQKYFPSNMIGEIRDTNNVNYFLIVFNTDEKVMYRYIQLIGEEGKKYKIPSVNKKITKEQRVNYRANVKVENQKSLEQKDKKREEGEESKENRVYKDKLSVPEAEIWDIIKENHKNKTLLLMFHFHKETYSIDIIENLTIHFNNRKPLLKEVTDKGYYPHFAKNSLGFLNNIEYFIIFFSQEDQTMYKYSKLIGKPEKEIIMQGFILKGKKTGDNNSNKKSAINKDISKILKSKVIDFNELIQSFNFDMTYTKLLEFLELEITDDQLKKLEEKYQEDWVLKIKKLLTAEFDEEFIINSEELRKWVEETVIAIDKKEEESIKKFISENISTEEGISNFTTYLIDLKEEVIKLNESISYK